MSPFGIALRILRLRKGQSQIALCDALGIDRGRVSAWETGMRVVPDEPMISRICTALKADALEADELRQAARFSSNSFRLPRQAVPELYPVLHKLTTVAKHISKADALNLDRIVSQLVETSMKSS